MTIHVAEAPSALAASPDAAETWFSTFYQDTFDTAYRYARLLCHDASTAEDITSDAYLRAWAKRDSLSGGGSPLAWVLTVIRNRVIDEFRSRRVTVDIEQLSEQADLQGLDGARELSAEEMAQIHRAIGRLTPEQQQVIFLRFFQKLSHEDVARELARSANAVRATQFRALARLRRILEAPHAG